jgi:uncharacterized protein YjbJ (UPF0337 family)
MSVGGSEFIGSETRMALNLNQIKGRIKQATGAVTGDRKLQRDGRRDERTESAKKKADAAIDAVHDKIAGVAETLHPGDTER